MTVGKTSVVCWIVFSVMCFLGVPAAGIILTISALPLIVRIALCVLEVSLPGRAAYATDVRLCASQYLKGSTLTVYAHPRNHKRV